MFWRRALLGVSLVLSLMLVGRILFSDQGYFAYRDLKIEYDDLKARLAGVEEDNLGLSRSIRLLQHDEPYIERVIRQRMNFVKEDEILYIFPANRKQASGAVQDEGKD